MAFNYLNPLFGYNPASFGAPSDFDVIVLQGQTCPGICRLSGFERKWKFDKKGGKGANGVDSTGTGKGELSGTIKFFVWTSLQFLQWSDYIALFQYDITKQKLQALQVYHPSLAELGISQLLCEYVTPFVHEGSGLFTRDARMLEFSPPPKAAAVSTPTRATVTSTSKPNPAAIDPTAALQARIAQLTKQYQGI